MITIDLYLHDRTRPQWHATIPGASGSGLTPWEALAEALAVWKRRGCPDAAPAGAPRGGADWVITAIFDRGADRMYRYTVRGINLNAAPGTYGREIAWDVRDLDNPRYEVLPGAWETWRCLTCTRLGCGPAPARCPSCDSEQHHNHGPIAPVREAA